MNSTIHIDQMGRSVKLTAPPRRIISIVPSQTELLSYFDMEDEVIGITKFCVHPKKWFQEKTRIGGTKKLHLDKIRALQPDLIIANKEENTQAEIEALAKEFPVWISDIYTLSDAYEMILKLGEVCNKTGKSKALVQTLQAQFAKLNPTLPKQKVAYFIWHNPMMVAAKHTFIDDLLEKAGFENIFGNKERYPEVLKSELAANPPEIILLSSEPFPFKTKHLEEFQEICPTAVIKLVDGELFSWYGSRLLHTVTYFKELAMELSNQPKQD